MRILISNDDGVMAPGIAILANILASIATVDVMAPDRNRSGASSALTLSHPLRVSQLSNGFYSVQGTPTDCVHLALTGFFKESYDLVVSGINDGVNLGDDILYSGTVAAAMEGCNLGLPAIAVSLEVGNNAHYETAGLIVRDLALKVTHFPLPARTLLNINVPDVAFSALHGVDVTRSGSRHKAEPMVASLDPRGHEIYWVGKPGKEADAGPGTDFHALSQGRVSITPLQLDMTHYNTFAAVSSWTQEFAWAK